MIHQPKLAQLYFPQNASAKITILPVIEDDHEQTRRIFQKKTLIPDERNFENLDFSIGSSVYYSVEIEQRSFIKVGKQKAADH